MCERVARNPAYMLSTHVDSSRRISSQCLQSQARRFNHSIVKKRSRPRRRRRRSRILHIDIIPRISSLMRIKTSHIIIRPRKAIARLTERSWGEVMYEASPLLRSL